MMKKPSFWSLGAYAILLICAAGCSKNSSATNTWEASKSTADLSDSKALWGNETLTKVALIGPSDEDFIPLEEEDLKVQFADGAIPQSKRSPGEPGSGLPSIDHYYKPTAYLATVFRNVYFNTDDHILRGKDALMLVDQMSTYLKEHPKMYVFIEGHCDERGAEAYNLALGARRANYVRSLFVQKGVDLNQLHTISYGKERPADFGHGGQAWSKNRRAEFKLYEMK